MNQADQATAYMATLKRIEQDIAQIDLDTALASIAISLRRIADAQTTLSVAWSSASPATPRRRSPDSDAIIASVVVDAVFEAFRAHSSPTVDHGDAHSARGQSGMIIWQTSHQFIRATISELIRGLLRNGT